MAHTFVPVDIKPYLVPFLFKEFKCIEMQLNGRKIKAAKVTNHTSLGKFLRLLMEKSFKKNPCDKSSLIFLRVQNKVNTPKNFNNQYKFVDGRYSFLYLPEEAENFLNDHLEEKLQNALMHYINSWHEKEGEDGIDVGIVKFFVKYNLEDYNFNIAKTRRDYYRKLKRNYFKGVVQFNSLNGKVEIYK